MAVPSSDRISLLPDSLLEDILARLPLQEVVRTSVLSKRWIPLWTQLPRIVLDKSFCTDLVRNDKDRLVRIITNIVVRSRKPIIDFTFSLNGVSSFNIDQIVNYVCNNGVEYFKLEIPNHKIFKLSSLDQLRLVKHLSLESCLIEVPCEFRGFTMLTCLKFYNVDIDGGELSSLVSNCPLLETLALENLRCCNYLVLSSPNLRVFRCEGFYLDFCLESTPRLEEMTVSVYDTEYDVEVDSDGPADIAVPFKVIPAIKYLALDGSFLMYMNLGMQQKNSRCRNVLNHLKLIKLTDVPLELIEVSQNVFSLIRRSPNLDTIVVTTCTEHTASDQGVRVWQTENLSDVSLNVLREVCLLNITNKLSELLFIEMLLAKSPMLKAVVFRLYDGLSKEEGLRLAEKIRLFRCASSKVNFFEVDPQTKADFQGYLL